jgi:hypothetical protein
MKRKITTLLIGLIISGYMVAQPPQAFKYQAVVRDAAGEIMSNQAVDIRISIHDATTGGTIVYQETFSETTNQFGLVNLNIGLGTPVTGIFSNIDWSNDSKFIEIEIDSGSGYISMGTSELFSVPYALYSDRSSDGYWGLYNSSIYYNNGNVGVGTSNPLDKLHVANHIRIGEDITYPTVYGEIKHDGSNNGLVFNSQAGGSWADMHFQTNGTTKMFIESGGSVGIGTTTPSGRFTVKSSGYTDGMKVIADDDDRIFRIRQMSGGGGGIYAFDGSDNATILLNGEGNCWFMSGNVGIGTTSPTSKLDVRGNVTIRNASTGSVVMELGTGLDYAEGFNVEDKTEIESGTVLCIDTKNPGKLKISENPYDKTVAGIVAGANGLGSGVRLGTQEFDCDVALAGRVYCNAIATSEDIEPGDMLTTSSIPGYAMKAADHLKAQGAIIGKAMEGLKKGEKGQILVLVTLQ